MEYENGIEDGSKILVPEHDRGRSQSIQIHLHVRHGTTISEKERLKMIVQVVKLEALLFSI